MKIKLKNSNYNEETGVSITTIITDLGEFSGKAKLHPEDKDIASNFAGCQYAEMRAVMKYIKQKIRMIKEDIKSLTDCQKVLKNKKDYNHNSVENRTIRKQIYLLNNQKVEWMKKLDSLKERLITTIEQREKFVKSLAKKGEEK